MKRKQQIQVVDIAYKIFTRNIATGFSLNDLVYILKNETTNEEYEWFMQCVEHEKKHGIILNEGESIEDEKPFTTFIAMLRAVVYRKSFLELNNDLTQEEQLRALHKLKKNHEEMCKGHDVSPGLCFVISMSLNKRKITVREHLFLYKEIRKELQERNYTHYNNTYWLCDQKDISTRINFIDALINHYKQ